MSSVGQQPWRRCGRRLMGLSHSCVIWCEEVQPNSALRYLTRAGNLIKNKIWEQVQSGNKPRATGSSHNSCSSSRHIAPALAADSFLQHWICFGTRTNAKKRSDVLLGVFNLSRQLLHIRRCTNRSGESWQQLPHAGSPPRTTLGTAGAQQCKGVL